MRRKGIMHGITLCIPGGDVISLRHLVLDYNGTLAAGGKLLPGVAEHIDEIASDSCADGGYLWWGEREPEVGA